MLRTTSIQSICHSPAVTATTNATLAHVRELMTTYRLHHVPIVNDSGTPLGVVSQVDLNQIANWRSRFGNLEGLAEKRDKQLFESLLADEVMSSPAITIHEDAKVDEAAELIERHRVHCLPIVDSSGQITGILTAHDLLRLAYLS